MGPVGTLPSLNLPCNSLVHQCELQKVQKETKQERPSDSTQPSSTHPIAVKSLVKPDSILKKEQKANTKFSQVANIAIKVTGVLSILGLGAAAFYFGTHSLNSQQLTARIHELVDSGNCPSAMKMTEQFIFANAHDEALIFAHQKCEGKGPLIEQLWGSMAGDAYIENLIREQYAKKEFNSATITSLIQKMHVVDKRDRLFEELAISQLPNCDEALQTLEQLQYSYHKDHALSRLIKKCPSKAEEAFSKIDSWLRKEIVCEDLLKEQLSESKIEKAVQTVQTCPSDKNIAKLAVHLRVWDKAAYRCDEPSQERPLPFGNVPFLDRHDWLTLYKCRSDRDGLYQKIAEKLRIDHQEAAATKIEANISGTLQNITASVGRLVVQGVYMGCMLMLTVKIVSYWQKLFYQVRKKTREAKPLVAQKAQ